MTSSSASVASAISADELSEMTKAELQTFADENGITGVSSSKQTKAEMVSTILSALGGE